MSREWRNPRASRLFASGISKLRIVFSLTILRVPSLRDFQFTISEGKSYLVSIDWGT
jgi:hypothetical protein